MGLKFSHQVCGHLRDVIQVHLPDVPLMLLATASILPSGRQPEQSRGRMLANSWILLLRCADKFVPRAKGLCRQACKPAPCGGLVWRLARMRVSNRLWSCRLSRRQPGALRASAGAAAGRLGAGGRLPSQPARGGSHQLPVRYRPFCPLSQYARFRSSSPLRPGCCGIRDSSRPGTASRA